MNSLPANQRGSGAGMAGTFNVSASVLSIGIFFSLMILGLAASLPGALYHGRTAQGVSPAIATRGVTPAAGRGASSPHSWATTPYRSSSATPSCPTCQPHTAAYLTSRQFFPHLIAAPFSKGLTEAFSFAAAVCVLGAVASLLRGGKYHYVDDVDPVVRDVQPVEPVGAQEAIAETEPLLVD